MSLPIMVSILEITKLAVSCTSGITPARAGKTPVIAFSTRSRQDHPRSCGKDTSTEALRMEKAGSPPLVRERQAIKDGYLCRIGITPARAGKTRIKQRIPSSIWDHPRSCGKDSKFPLTGSSDKGSPPLVRERLVGRRLIRDVIGITPARAGKTYPDRQAHPARQDHPRSCGKDSNGSLYFRPFTPADIQNLFNFFAKHLTSSASPNVR